MIHGSPFGTCFQIEVAIADGSLFQLLLEGFRAPGSGVVLHCSVNYPAALPRVREPVKYANRSLR